MRDEPYEFQALANYNAERSRGLLHADDWLELMAREQARFDRHEPSRFHREMAARYAASLEAPE